MTSTTNTKTAAKSQVAAYSKDGVQLYRSTAERSESAPVLYGTIGGKQTALFMAKGTDKKFMNVVQDGVQVGTANVIVASWARAQLVVAIGDTKHYFSFRAEVSKEDRVAMGLSTEKLSAQRDANIARHAEKQAANEEAAKVAA